MADTPALRNGRFVLRQPIGEGAQGRTFDGVDTRAPGGGERAVAIKRFDVRGAKSWKDVELAEREARVLQSLSHPKLPAYVDHFEEDGALYLVMEKIDGESLGAYRSRAGALGEAEVLRLLRDASEVLDYLHGRVPPVIHRDLKPGNVIRRPDGSFAFVDFGAVRDKLRHKGGSTVVGTFGYMAPEQMQGRALPASDVYAIGATALAMLTDHEPEELPHRGLALDVRQALRPHADSRRDSGATDSGPSARLVEALQRMLEPDPDRRASRIAPLLVGLDSRRTDDPRERKACTERSSRHSARRARRAARRAQRRAGRVAQWEAVRTRRVPWPARLVFI
ncbi:MAG: serine/threonine protein kinase, partial [Myxococcota bacterium]|nr:serine/threonine protein kinase [Myxococcota bacterium]